jgi:hypothetical protein
MQSNMAKIMDNVCVCVCVCVCARVCVLVKGQQSQAVCMPEFMILSYI